jgi:hypothetical protein
MTSGEHTKGHTELPWRVGSGPSIWRESYRDDGGRRISQPIADFSSPALLSDSEKLANAKLTVEAVNSVAAFRQLLIEALDTRAPDYVETKYHGWHARAIEAVNSAPVTAVNTYPAVEGLVEALDGALKYLRGSNPLNMSGGHRNVDLREQIESALSRFRSLQNGGKND